MRESAVEWESESKRVCVELSRRINVAQRMYRRVAISNEIGNPDLAALMCLQIEFTLYGSGSL